MSQGGSSKPLPILSLAFLLIGVLGAVSACGDPANMSTAFPADAVVQTTTMESTAASSTDLDATPSGTTASTAPGPEGQKLLGQLQDAARRASFTVYYLGPAYRQAAMAGVMSGDTDAGDAPQLVDIVYRHDDPRERLVVYLSQYDPAVRPDLKKPFSDWTLVREVQTNGHTDAVYRGTKPAGALLYVAQRGSTEISLTGYASAGYLSDQDLIDIAALLVPVL